MKLYEVPRNTTVRILEDDDGPPGAHPCVKGDIVKFRSIDGMYSYCSKEGVDIPVHIKAWTEVEIVDQKEIVK